MINWIIAHIEKLIALGTGLGGAAVVGVKTFKYVVKIKKWFDEQDNDKTENESHRTMVKEALKELMPNGGGSIKDKINEIVYSVDVIKGRQTAILHEIPTPMYESSGENSMVDVNRAWCELTGMDKHDAQSGWSSIIHKDDLDRIIEEGKRFRLYGKNYNSEFRVVHFITKKVIPVKATATKITGKDGKTISIIGILTKI